MGKRRLNLLAGLLVAATLPLWSSAQSCGINCATCPPNVTDGTALGCTLCRNSHYLAGWLPTPACFETCDAYGWTIGIGQGRFSRRCLSLPETIPECVIPGSAAAAVSASPELVNRCSVSNTTVGCPSVTTFDVSNQLGGATPTDPAFRICATSTTCIPEQFQFAAPTTTTDRVCRIPLAACPVNNYQVAAPTATSDRSCSAVTPSCASTAFEAAGPTATTDRVCPRYTKCTAGVTVQVTATTPTSDRVCQNVTACTPAEFETAAPTLLVDRQCTNLTVCPAPTTYTGVASTATSDRTCANTTVCNSTSYQSTPSTSVADAVCTPITPCDPFFAEVVPPTYTTDRVCALADAFQCRFELRSSADLHASPERLSGILPAIRSYVLVSLGLPGNAVSQSLVLRSNESALVGFTLPRFSDVVALRNECAGDSVVVLASDAVLSCRISTFFPAETTTTSTMTTPTVTSSTVSTATATTATATSSTVTATSRTATSRTATTPTSSSTPSFTSTVTSSSTTTTSSTTTSTGTSTTVTGTGVTVTSVTTASTATATGTTSTTTSSTTTSSTVTSATSVSMTTRTVTATTATSVTATSATTTTLTATTATATSTTTSTTSSTVTTSTVTTTTTITTTTSTGTTQTSTMTNSSFVSLSAATSTDSTGATSSIVILVVGLCFFVLAAALLYRNRKARSSGYDVTAGPSAVVVNDGGFTASTGQSNGRATRQAALATHSGSAPGTPTTMGLDAVGARVTVLGYPGQGTLQYYGRHAYQPGFRCGVELDAPDGNNDGTIKGYYYFECSENHGVLVDVRKVTFAGAKSSVNTASSPATSVDHAAASIGDDGIANGDSKATQIEALQKQLKLAEETFEDKPKRRHDAKYDAAESFASKNRYRDIAPYDENRVVLSGSVEYINASYVKFASPAAPLHAISCQGPKTDTVDDTWQMIAEQKIGVIVMVTNLHEGMSDKCSQYWPEVEGETEVYGECEVTWTATEQMSSHVVRKLSLVYRGETRTVSHVQYVGWPDHGVPTDSKDFLAMVVTVEKMERRNPIKGSPLLVHCSAGVGRTGVFLMLRVLLDKLKRRVIPNLGDILEELRRQRMLLVQTPSQYVFCHEAAIAALKDPSFEYY